MIFSKIPIGTWQPPLSFASWPLPIAGAVHCDSEGKQRNQFCSHYEHSDANGTCPTAGKLISRQVSVCLIRVAYRSLNQTAAGKNEASSRILV